MTDPTFETREALEAWATNYAANAKYSFEIGYTIQEDYEAYNAQIARVKAAHAHLLKGQNDG